MNLEDILEVFIKRMKKLNIEVKLTGNCKHVSM